MNNQSSYKVPFVLTFKTLDTLFHVVSGKVTLARCLKTGRFVKLNKVTRIFQNLLIVARKYVAACKTERVEQSNKGAYMQAKNMLDNALRFFNVSDYVKINKNKLTGTKNILTMIVA